MLSVNCWPTASHDGTVEVSIEYELEHIENITLYDTVISIPLPYVFIIKSQSDNDAKLM